MSNSVDTDKETTAKKVENENINENSNESSNGKLNIDEQQNEEDGKEITSKNTSLNLHMDESSDNLNNTTTTTTGAANDEKATTNDDEISQDKQSKRRKSSRRVDRGLDGGYWSRLGTLNLNDENKSDNSVSTAAISKRKRKTVERLYVGDMLVKDDDDDTRSSTTGTIKTTPSVEKQHNTTITTTSSNTSTHHNNNKKDQHVRLYKAKAYLTVRNETDSFFLCQTINSIYDGSKRCKIQWLEAVRDNEYKYAYVDWIDPLTIITTVKVRRLENKLMQIVENDLNKVQKLLEQAIKNGGIEMELHTSSDDDIETINDDDDDDDNDEEDDDDDEEEEDDDDNDDEEDTEEIGKKRKRSSKDGKREAKVRKTSKSEIKVKKLGKKQTKKKIINLDSDPYTFNDDRSTDSNEIKISKIDSDAVPSVSSESTESTSVPTANENETKSSSSITITPTTNRKTHLEHIRDKVIERAKKHAQKSQQSGKNVSKSPSSVAAAAAVAASVSNKIKKEIAKKSTTNDENSDAETESVDSDKSSNFEAFEDNEETKRPQKKKKFFKKITKPESDDEKDDENGDGSDVESEKRVKKVTISDTKPVKKAPTTPVSSSSSSSSLVKPTVSATTTPKSSTIKTTTTTTTSKSTTPTAKTSTTKKPATTTPSSSTKITSKTPTSEQQKKKLLKAISNRFLEENQAIQVYQKDPLFEDTIEMPYISALSNSRLAFRAINLNDMQLLKQLINDRQKVSSLTCVEQSLYLKLTPLKRAIACENKDAIELLFDEQFNNSNEQQKRIEMPKTMFEKFNTGTWNPQTFNAHFVRTLTQSRGSKEGNNAFLKDTINTGNYNRFETDLAKYCLKIGVKPEIYDLINDKVLELYQRQLQYKTSSRSICKRNDFFVYTSLENLNVAILNGNRKLAAHILEKGQLQLNAQGFNSLHVDVLKYDGDEELRTQVLRMQVCLKKSFFNDALTPLHCACINPNTKYLKILLNITQEFNAADKKSRKLIHFAAVCESSAPLEYLLSRNVSQYECDTSGSTPLHYACEAGRSANVEVLLKHAKQKANEEELCTNDVHKFDNKYGIGGINKPNRQGKCALHLAIENDNYECVKILIKYGCNVEIAMSNSMAKITPLMYATQLHNFRIVQLLRENGARIESRDRFMRTPAIHASICGSTRVLSYLLRQGANCNAFDSSSNSCLHYACAYGWYFCVKLLVEAGATLNSTNDWKLTPFSVAFLKGHIGICEQLLKLQTAFSSTDSNVNNKIDINFRTESGETLIMLTVSNYLSKQTYEQLTYIIKKLGGNACLIDSNGNNALHYLAKNTFILTNDNDYDDDNDEKHKKELKAKAESYRQEMTKFLISNKCLVNLTNNQIETPLHVAIKSLNTSYAKYLLLNYHKDFLTENNGASDDGFIKQNLNGKTFLHLICEYSLKSNAYELLLNETCDDVNVDFIKKYELKFQLMAQIEDDLKRTPLQLAFLALNEHLRELKNQQKNDDSTPFVIPAGYRKLIQLLYQNFKSNINKSIYIYDKNEIYDNNDDDDNVKKSDDGRVKKFLYQIPTIFLLVNDLCCDLIKDLIKISNEFYIDTLRGGNRGGVSSSGSPPAANSCNNCIDFDVLDNHDCTYLHKAIILKQTSLCKLIINLNCCNLEKKILNSKYLNENCLHLTIRHKLFDIYDMLIDNLYLYNQETFLVIIRQTNLNKENLLHLLCSLLTPNERLTFGIERLNKLFHSIKQLLTKTCNDKEQQQQPEADQKYLQFNHEFLNTQNNQLRIPLHLCLLNRDYSCNGNNNSNIDLEMFLIENGSNFHIKDVYKRLPIHYLFCSTIGTSIKLDKQLLTSNTLNLKLHLNNLNVNLIDPVELLTILTTQMSFKQLDECDIYGLNILHYAIIRGSTICCSYLLSNAFKDSLFVQCNLGNTPLSLAVYLKRETCVLTLLKAFNIQHDVLTADGVKKSLTNGNSTVNVIDQTKQSLKSFYYYHEKDYNEETSAINEHDINELKSICWLPKTLDKNYYPLVKQTLFELIIKNNWEGISWLILGQLEDFGLRRLDTIVYAINAGNYNLALRLIEKYERQDIDAVSSSNNQEITERNFHKEILTQTIDNETKRTLLHILCLQENFNQSNELVVMKILNKILFLSDVDLSASKKQLIIRKKFFEIKQLIKEFYLLKDAYSCTAMHYACLKHNFVLIDYLLKNFNLIHIDDQIQQQNQQNETSATTTTTLNGNAPIDMSISNVQTLNTSGSNSNNGDNYNQLLFLAKDSLEQTAFSLLFWLIGRIEYTVEIKDKILFYYKTYLIGDGDSLNSVACKKINDSIKAYYPLIDVNNFGYINKLVTKHNDYPNCFQTTNKILVNPLLYSINRQDLSMCKYLIQTLYFDVNSSDHLNHIPAIVYAIKTNSIKCVRLLLNPDYDLKDANEKIKKPNLNRDLSGGKNRLTNLFAALEQPIKKSNNEEEDGDSDDDDNNYEMVDDDIDSDNDDNEMNITATTSLNQTENEDALIHDENIYNPNKFQIKSNINLFHLDNESRSIFHHLAQTLDYGSYSNVNICKLILFCKKKFEESNKNAVNEQQQIYFNEELKQFIKHLDKKSNTAIDYAVKNGNFELAEELRKFLTTSGTSMSSGGGVKPSVFYVNDPFYAGPNAIPDFKYDSDELLRKNKLLTLDSPSLNTSNNSIRNQFINNNSEIEHDLFKVDEYSQMQANGELVWDMTYKQPYDCILTKTDLNYGIHGMYNFYKLQLIKQKFSHATTSSSMEVDKSAVADDESNLYILFTRWGRIGDVGQYQRTPYSNFTDAKAEFFKLFKQKTGNDYQECVQRKEKQFELKAKKYNLITFDMRNKSKLIDLNFDLPTISQDSIEQAIATGETIECKLKNNEYIKFFFDLCDVSYLKNKLLSRTHLATNYIPLTRLSRQHIETAYDFLTNEIKPLIDERLKLQKQLAQAKSKELLADYAKLVDKLNLKSSHYYQLMPQYNYEFEKLQPLFDYNDYDNQLSMLLQLIDYQYAIKILMGSYYTMKHINPIDYIYNAINCKLQYMKPNDYETQYILRYIWSSTKHKPQYGFGYDKTISVERIFKFERVGEEHQLSLGGSSASTSSGGNSASNRDDDVVKKQSVNTNKYLLWHGTSTENMLSIMSKGLIKSPIESNKHGARFGKGIYTSDSFNMSANYSHGKKIESKADNNNEHKYMLLCEVSLGKVYELIDTNEHIEHAPDGYDSVKVRGQYEPNEQYNIQLPNGCKIPLGNLIEAKLNETNIINSFSSVQTSKKLNNQYQYYRSTDTYNQFIVYNEAQVCIRYIIQFRQ